MRWTRRKNTMKKFVQMLCSLSSTCYNHIPTNIFIRDTNLLFIVMYRKKSLVYIFVKYRFSIRLWHLYFYTFTVHVENNPINPYHLSQTLDQIVLQVQIFIEVDSLFWSHDKFDLGTEFLYYVNALSLVLTFVWMRWHLEYCRLDTRMLHFVFHLSFTL